jgi:hypothetical protein
MDGSVFAGRNQNIKSARGVAADVMDYSKTEA